MKKIYVSTGSFRTKNIEEILEIATCYDIKNIELSSGLEYNSETIKIIQRVKDNFNFLVHNYFPTPRESFALNLASLNNDVKTSSLKLCKEAVDIARSLGSEFYSVHAGFTFDSSGKELGNKEQMKLKRIPIELAKKQFIANLYELCAYASQYNIKIAIENNVLAQYAAQEQDLYLGVTTNDLIEILAKVNHRNLYILLDLAHAKVSNTFLKFGLDDMIDRLEDHIIAVHISENNGHFDQNIKLDKNSILLPYLKKLHNKVIVLESYDLSPIVIKEQINLLEEHINNDC